MKILSISTDRKIFEEGSSVRQRAVEYAGLFDELHVVVFNNRFKIKDSTRPNVPIRSGRGLKVEQIGQNCWIYPTNSWSRWFYIWDAIRIGRAILSKPSTLNPVPWVLDSQDPFECGLVAMKLSRKNKLPLRVQIHTDFMSPFFSSLSFLNRIRVRIAKRVLPYATSIRVVSERIKESLLKTTNYKLKTAPLVLPIFTDIKKIQETNPIFDLKKKYPDWHFIILVVARLSNEKNISQVLEIMSRLLRNYPRIGMVIVGEGPLKESLKSKVKSQKLENNVVFEGRQEDVISYYKTAHLFIQTSLYEGFGLALLEAVASGCPAVSSDVGIAPELLSYPDQQFVCPVGDTECFVSLISRFIEDNRLRELFTLDIAPIAVGQFTQSKEAYLRAYKETFNSQ